MYEFVRISVRMNESVIPQTVGLIVVLKPRFSQEEEEEKKGKEKKEKQKGKVKRK